MFSFAQEFSQRKFFVCNPSSESKYCKVTSLPVLPLVLSYTEVIASTSSLFYRTSCLCGLGNDARKFYEPSSQ